MNEDARTPPEDLGPPAVELQRLNEPAREGFVNRLRAAIYRRDAAGQVLDFSIPVFFSVVKEFIGMLFSALAPADRPAGSDRDNSPPQP